MPEILYCDEKCVNKLSSVFGSLTSDEITNDLLSAKDKVISKMAHKVAAFGNLDGEEMMKIFDFLFSHPDQLVYSSSIIMILGLIVALSNLRIAERLVVPIAAMLKALLLGKVIFHYQAIIKVCEEVSKAFSRDGLGGYALVGHLYSPILLIVELSAIFTLACIVFGRLTRNMGRSGTVVKLLVLSLLLTYGAMAVGHIFVSLGVAKSGGILISTTANLRLSITTAFVISISYLLYLTSNLLCKTREYYEDPVITDFEMARIL